MPRRLPALLLFFALPAAAAEIPPIARVLPPVGLEIPADVRERLEKRLVATRQRLKGIQDRQLHPDVEVFAKAVELALLHREFYVERDFAKADWALDQANERLDSLTKGEAPWTKATGLVVRGYRSMIDDSIQPMGLVIPKDHDFTKPSPLYVWLHGRGDKSTDLHFLKERATSIGQIAPPNAIVLHPFGRHCVGWKHAGEVDVIEAMFWLRRKFEIEIDQERVVLIGFSMGGAGAWHLGAHYPQEWIAVSPGAGFAETARYQKLTPDRYPPPYEQALWGMYDVPNYVRNLFNTQVIAYSGELDKQIQAAHVMEEAYRAEGRTLTHRIGPGVEHKYEPATLKTLLADLDRIVANPPSGLPKEVHLQTRTLQYSKYKWAGIFGLEEHWQDSRLDAKAVGDREMEITTKNVTDFAVRYWDKAGGRTIRLNGERFQVERPADGDRGVIAFHRAGGGWRIDADPLTAVRGRKHEDQQGPIDHAFMSTFLVVTPTGKSRHPAFQAWCDAELAHFRDRWRALMRGSFREVRDVDLPKYADEEKYTNLILWGDADSNSAIRDLKDSLPVQWNADGWSLGNVKYSGNQYVPVLICPRPNTLANYFVLNSGLTFREGHDHTNSLQNPKLPDWAIVDLSQPPDRFAPGKIHDAGFFDEQWQLKGQPKAP